MDKKILIIPIIVGRMRQLYQTQRYFGNNIKLSPIRSMRDAHTELQGYEGVVFMHPYAYLGEEFDIIIDFIKSRNRYIKVFKLQEISYLNED